MASTKQSGCAVAENSLSWCLSQLGKATHRSARSRDERQSEADLCRALIAIRKRHIKASGGIARYRERGGLLPLLELLRRPRAGKTLDLALSILANCCTEEGTRTEVRNLGGIPPLVTVLKCLNAESVQNRAARALGNLAVNPENSALIHKAGEYMCPCLCCHTQTLVHRPHSSSLCLPPGAVSHLLHALRLSSDSECLQSVIRALRHLSDSPAHRLALLTQGALPPLVERLGPDVSQEVTLASLSALWELTRGCSQECALEMSKCDALVKLGALALSQNGSGAGQDLLREPSLKVLCNACLQGSLRPTIGSVGAIPRFVEEIRREPSKSGHYVRALCLCCREAVNRTKVRESGGLELLVSLLDGRTAPSASIANLVVYAFIDFIYDEVALEQLQAAGLVPLLVARLVDFARGKKLASAEGESHDQQEEEDEEVACLYTQSFDYPSDGPPKRDAAESSQSSTSFLSLRSWLISEGYIASPGELSPQWSPVEGVLDLEGLEVGGGSMVDSLNPSSLEPPEVDGQPTEGLESGLSLGVPSGPEGPALDCTGIQNVERYGEGGQQALLESTHPFGSAEGSAADLPLVATGVTDTTLNTTDGHLSPTIENLVKLEQPKPRSFMPAQASRCRASGQRWQTMKLDLEEEAASIRKPCAAGSEAAHPCQPSGRNMEVDHTISLVTMGEIRTPPSGGCRRRMRGRSRSSQGEPPSPQTPLDSSLTTGEKRLGTAANLQLQQQQLDREFLSTPVRELLQSTEVSLGTPQSANARSHPYHPEPWGPDAPLLLLLSRFSQALDPSAVLVTPSVLGGLLDYLTLSPNPSPRCFRLLSRLTCNPNCLEAFVRIFGVSMVRLRLILSSDLCLGGGGGEGSSASAPEKEVFQRIRQLGTTLLQNLRVQSESPFGIGVLSHMMMSGSEGDKVACTLALPFLCRSEAMLRKLLLDHGGLQLTLDLVFSSSSCHAGLTLEALCGAKTPVSGVGAQSQPPQLSSPFYGLLVDAITFLLGHGEEDLSKDEVVERRVKDNRRTTSLVPTTGGTGQGCTYKLMTETGEADLVFLLDDGFRVAASRHAITNGSDYFRAMLLGDFSESRSVAGATIQIRDVPPEIFIPVLHHLHGCSLGTLAEVRCPEMAQIITDSQRSAFSESPLGRTMEGANRFLLPAFKKQLEALLDFEGGENRLEVSLENLPAIYFFSKQHYYPEVARRCLRFLFLRSPSVLEGGTCLATLISESINPAELSAELHDLIAELLR
ncbi:armadillo repeat-containing protein 5 isoform X1 [Polypterus senegalus]|uniref:armadillo repeat-containing protein 5 isoform X1 n=1 Tax=Polypterus senegalus TaxID=55291 RepID=UPI001963851C|nr:armadillo repeat-containing protein 5 isoform X1 [Polypterus senegalus]